MGLPSWVSSGQNSKSPQQVTPVSDADFVDLTASGQPTNYLRHFLPPRSVLAFIFTVSWSTTRDCAGFYPEFFEYVCLKGYAEFLPISLKSAVGARFLQTVVDSKETLEARRMNTKLNAIGYALRK
ncbi:hypothetical protein FOPE_02420 [Fonsecaea pedrosoi]|nr:hypothetical protein FOPE_02420 [Fonsecaea pedrosoi]